MRIASWSDSTCHSERHLGFVLCLSVHSRPTGARVDDEVYHRACLDEKVREGKENRIVFTGLLSFPLSRGGNARGRAQSERQRVPFSAPSAQHNSEKYEFECREKESSTHGHERARAGMDDRTLEFTRDSSTTSLSVMNRGFKPSLQIPPIPPFASPLLTTFSISLINFFGEALPMLPISKQLKYISGFIRLGCSRTLGEQLDSVVLNHLPHMSSLELDRLLVQI